MAHDDLVRAVYEQSYRRLVTHFTALSGSLPKAQDVVQEAFLAGVTQRHDFAEAPDQEAWLRAVASGLLRRGRLRAELAGRVRGRSRAEPSIDLGPRATEDDEAVVYALGRLSLPVRVTVVLRHVDGLGVAQIARELSVPEGTVRARLALAHAEMADHLRDFAAAGRV